jgi:hypothetical protein
MDVFCRRSLVILMNETCSEPSRVVGSRIVDTRYTPVSCRFTASLQVDHLELESSWIIARQLRSYIRHRDSNAIFRRMY